jgi:hypothetical protein
MGDDITRCQLERYTSANIDVKTSGISGHQGWNSNDCSAGKAQQSVLCLPCDVFSA